ncbi:uncharacterized protein TNCT_407461 [Trichonephila clavata]|uniref:Uncharacterized protein n=1 Tax=Trichonephila clavata TaxID=2740835 RepID=A0A8X6KST7_TRICU|nr:uncharacterized protein TNCT_407461 [Trichonephila clavata]
MRSVTQKSRFVRLSYLSRQPLTFANGASVMLDPVIAKCMRSKLFTFCGGVLGFGFAICSCVAVPYVLKLPRYNSHLALLFLLGGVGLSLGYIFTNKFLRLVRRDKMAASDLNLPQFSRKAREPKPGGLPTIVEKLGNFTKSNLNYFSHEMWKPRSLRRLTKTRKLPKSPEIDDFYVSHRRKKSNSTHSSSTYSPHEIGEPRQIQFNTSKRLPKLFESRLSYFSNDEKLPIPVRRQNTTGAIPKWMLSQIQEEEVQEDLFLLRKLRNGDSKSSEAFKMEGCHGSSSSSSGSEKSFTSSDDSLTLKNLKSSIRRN